MVLTGVVWNANCVEGFVTWLVMPLGTCLLTCLAWSAQAQAWRIVSLRASISRLPIIVFGWCWAGVTLMAGVAVANSAANSGGHALGFGVVLRAGGTGWLSVSLWLAGRVGQVASIGVAMVALVAGLLFGGTWMADTNLWLVGFVAWPISASTLPRAGLTVGLAAALTVVGAVGWI